MSCKVDKKQKYSNYSNDTSETSCILYNFDDKSIDNMYQQIEDGFDKIFKKSDVEFSVYMDESGGMKIDVRTIIQLIINELGEYIKICNDKGYRISYHDGCAEVDDVHTYSHIIDIISKEHETLTKTKFIDVFDKYKFVWDPKHYKYSKPGICYTMNTIFFSSDKDDCFLEVSFCMVSFKCGCKEHK